jgi:hypothetical protein
MDRIESFLRRRAESAYRHEFEYLTSIGVRGSMRESVSRTIAREAVAAAKKRLIKLGIVVEVSNGERV